MVVRGSEAEAQALVALKEVVRVIETIIGLVCEHPEHPQDQMPWGLEFRFPPGQRLSLRYKASENGWVRVRSESTPWRQKDICPLHAAVPIADG